MEKQEKILLASWIMCVDGTMLPSFNRHDYREHTTVDVLVKEHPNGEEEPDPYSDIKAWKKWNSEAKSIVKESRFAMIDGGTIYSRRGGVFTEMSIYSTDPYEVIRRFLCRGGRGKDSTEHLTWTPLFAINDSWLEALVEYEEDRNPDNLYTPYYKKEIEYRKTNNISISE